MKAVKRVKFARCPRCELWFSVTKGYEIVGLKKDELLAHQEKLEQRGLSVLVQKDATCFACSPIEESKEFVAGPTGDGTYRASDFTNQKPF